MYALVFVLFLIPILGSAQVEPQHYFREDRRVQLIPNEEIPADSVILYTDIEADFPGGIDSFKQFIAETLEYPSCGVHEPQGKVYLSMIIERDGSHTNHKVDKGFLKEYDEAALECIKKMPPWIPAELNGKKVRTMVRLPIVFMIE